MRQIKLSRGEWHYDPNARLGAEGGFGVVYAGNAEGYGPIAIKKLKIDAQEAAHRELRIAEEFAGQQFDHVMPFLDSGQDAESDSFFVVMPQAEKSLQDEFNNKSFSETETIEIVLQIATGLSEVPQIVHRDLKPGNVLYHNGKWKIADFGIARFIEESTSLRTLKECLSPYYAAPEQWNLERSTSATDIYALGCIGYALLTGQPPFLGGGLEDLRAQHLYAEPPKNKIKNPRLRSLLSMMLRKSPETRPSLDRVKSILTEIVKIQDEGSPGTGLNALAEAGAIAAERAAEEEAKRNFAASIQEKRHRVASEAYKIFREIVDSLVERIVEFAPTAKVSNRTRPSLSVHIGGAILEVKSRSSDALPENAFPKSGWDVILGATIQVSQEQPRPYKWGASLWYTNLGQGEEYRWWEVSYYAPLHRIEYQPFALENPTDADEAVARGGGYAYSVASGPLPIDDENVDDFCDRWAGLLAKAYQGKLEHPRYLPLQ
ncbi:MAG: serine/threonine-protein kinase [Candidatus Hodarchaeota archaeon]